MPDKFKNRYRIASTRLPNWDYGGNAPYFVTICTKDREHYFGKIVDAQMQLSKIGEAALDCWMKIPNHFPHCHLDESVIMPNHVHGIIIIEKPYFENRRFHIEDAKPILPLSEKEWGPIDKSNSIEHIKSKHSRFRNQGKNTLSAMVGSFKSAVTKECNENGLHFAWQTRFHEHIIRDAAEFKRIKNYILTNPGRWKEDKFFCQRPNQCKLYKM
jgi:REP element-mobilizing transposase RayT